MQNILLRNTMLFSIGGYSYCFIELMTRGFSHISMFIAGGVCFVFIGNFNKRYRYKMSLIGRMFISSIFITIVEFIIGVIVNIRMGLDVWDYSELPFNFKGQICLLFVYIWFALSFLAILLDNLLEYLFWNKGMKKSS